MPSTAIDFDQIQHQRLPTLYEVFILKTEPPVDLWSFYTYLSQFPYAINYLDFWIDLMAHIRLCKDYVSTVRQSVVQGSALEEFRNLDERSNVNRHMNNDEDASVTTSILMNTLLSEGYLDFENPEKVSQFLQGNTHTSPMVTRMIQDWKLHNERNSVAATSHLQSTQAGIDISRKESMQSVSAIVDEFLKRQSQLGEKGNITTKQLYSNAQQICNTYLMSQQHSPRYLANIPDDLKNQVIHNIKANRRHDPEVFRELKEVTYQFLETDCFPKFLKEVALHNIHDELSDWRFHPSNKNPHRTSSPSGSKENLNGHKQLMQNHISWSPFSTYTSLSRVLFGCMWMGIGFWIGYVLIFLHYSRAIRVTTVVPFGLGCYYIVCGIYQVDIIYSWFGLTQRLMYSHKKGNIEEGRQVYGATYNDDVPLIFTLLGGKSRLIHIEHPFIKKILYKRGLWCLTLVVIFTAIFTVIFCCVPGRRL
ncbi:Regulator of G protein signaling domain [Nakaseomyces glabratus]|nr:Regulator of G protein signaling domain [Nakaseomyces glabratus]KAH7598941.1 Regulator of G protein signaling domain [Nakaseomyces glabratus]KAI8401113.1 Regulator of G protein signaling domain [Nakaseomyces glabratus]KTB14865.1 Bud site selection protein RAX1 [Nakaseomyces glabratus]KTB25004.1 Bud site selection protein RAX1 [Nakaseomyces glabratus]